MKRTTLTFLTLVVCSALLLLAVGTPLDSFGDGPTFSQKMFYADSVCVRGIFGRDMAADANGLVYFVSLADCHDCAIGPPVCGAAYLSVLHSGHNSMLLPITIPYPDSLYAMRIAMDLVEGTALNQFYFGWSGTDECADDKHEVHYGTSLFDKRAPATLEISSYERVNAGSQHSFEVDVAVGVGDSLHFAWTDGRCTPETTQGGSIFYRRKEGSSWISGDPSKVCDDSDCRAVEVLISYDPEGGEPVSWEGCGEPHFVKMEEFTLGEKALRFARVVTMLGDACDSESGVLGVLKFHRLRRGTGFSPCVLQVLALRDGGIEDVTTDFRASGSGVEIGGRLLALRPVLELLPNPSTGLAKVKFGIPLDMGRQISLSVYDVRGRLLGHIYAGPNDGYVMAGEIGNGQGETPVLAPGIYFMRLTADGQVLKTEKLVLVK